MALIPGRGHKIERDMRFSSAFKAFGLFNPLESIASTAYYRFLLACRLGHDLLTNPLE